MTRDFEMVKLAARTRHEVFFFGFIIHRYMDANCLHTPGEVAARWGCDANQVVSAMLCRMPTNAKEVDLIAAHCRLSALHLREVASWARAAEAPGPPVAEVSSLSAV